MLTTQKIESMTKNGFIQTHTRVTCGNIVLTLQGDVSKEDAINRMVRIMMGEYP